MCLLINTHKNWSSFITSISSHFLYSQLKNGYLQRNDTGVAQIEVHVDLRNSVKDAVIYLHHFSVTAGFFLGFNL